MERCFIANKESQYNQDWDRYLHITNKQRDFVNTFFSKKSINGESYMIRGTGGVNIPFEEYDKKDINLYIEPTQENCKIFAKQLCKTNQETNLCKFKQSSKISKEFTKLCIDNKVIINLYQPHIGDYIISLYRYSINQFPYNNNLYLKIDSESLTKETSIPTDWQEIKCSYFYTIKDKYDKLKGDK